MKKRVAGFFMLFGLALNGHAQVTSSAGLTYLSDYRIADLGALSATLGYRFGDRWSFQPEIRAGVGVIDDTVPIFSMSAVNRVPTDVDLEYLVGVIARFQYRANEDLYFFAQPTLHWFEIDYGNVTGSAFLEDSAEWEFGGELGLGYLFNDGLGVEAGYGLTDGDGIFNLALRVYF